MNISKYKYMVCVVAALTLQASADLVALDDKSLGEATGEGLGFALENFVLNSDNADLSVTGITSSTGDPVDIKWTSLYIMGEGSEEGSINTGADIGSYLNPYSIRTARGSMGLDPSDPDYNSDYNQIGNDLALLEFATDSYQSDLQNSAIFGQFSFYQGCVWGEPGCNNLADVGANGIAVQNISAEIDELNSQRTAINNRYSLFLSELETEISSYYEGPILTQEAIVEVEQGDYDNAVSDLNTEYNQMKSAYDDFLAIRPQAECEIGRNCTGTNGSYCPNTACRNARSAYNDEREDWEDQSDFTKDEYNNLIGARQTLDAIKNDTDEFPVAGVSYIEAVEDVDKFKQLCGYEDSFTSCSNGLIARKETSKSGIESASIALATGQGRRNGLDVGASFEFKVNAVAENGSSSTRTDYLDIDMKGVFVDGSSLRLWSAQDEVNGGSEVNGELRLNLFIKKLGINVCDPQVCGGDEDLKAASTLNLDNLFVNLNLGYGEIQPLRFSATADGNFELELSKLNPAATGVDPNDKVAMQDFYDTYYAESPKSSIYIGDVRIGSGSEASLGSVTVDGLRAQYLKVTSRDL